MNVFSKSIIADRILLNLLLVMPFIQQNWNVSLLFVYILALILPYLSYLLDHDEERFKRTVVVDKNGASFNVVFDVADKRFYWLMLPIQLSPIPGLKQNLNLSDPFPPNKDFFDSNSNTKLEDSGVDDIMRYVLYLML